jgi:phospholipase/carboxylesterase
MNAQITPTHVLPPVSGKAPRQLIVMLHGVGSNGADMFGLASYWQHLLPDAEWIAPNAPFAFQSTWPGFGEEASHAYQWFSLSDYSLPVLEQRAQETLPVLSAFLDAELEKRQLRNEHLALMGFSQGAMMSLYASLSRPEPVGAVLAYSGLHGTPETISETALSKPNTLLVHGTADDIVPFQRLLDLEAGYKKAAIPHLVWRVEGLPHTIHEQGIRIGGEFLKHCFNKQSLEDFNLIPEDQLGHGAQVV